MISLILAAEIIRSVRVEIVKMDYRLFFIDRSYIFICQLLKQLDI